MIFIRINRIPGPVPGLEKARQVPDAAASGHGSSASTGDPWSDGALHAVVARTALRV